MQNASGKSFQGSIAASDGIPCRSSMKIIHRSIIKDLSLTFLLALAFLNSILMMEKLIRLSRMLSGIGATVPDFLRIIVYIQPQLFTLTIPMAMLLATLLVYGRLNADNELVILRASGMDFIAISRPVFILGTGCFVLALSVSFYFGPKSSISLREAITRIIAVRTPLAIEEGSFNTSFKGIVITVKGKKSANSLEDIFIYDSRQKDAPRLLTAKEGKFFSREGADVGLYLTDGHIHITKDRKVTEIFFDKYNMTLSLEAGSPTPKKSELSPPELLEKAKEAETQKKKTVYYLEFFRRLSLPLVCLILALLGPPLAMIAGKAGGVGGLALGLLTFTLYYVILIYGENLVLADRLHLVPGALAASGILSVAAGIMFVRRNRQ